MAEHFEILGTRLTQEILGGHDLIDVYEIQARSRPSGIYFTFNVGQHEHTPEHVSTHAERLATELERIMAHDHVKAVDYVQDIAHNGALVDHVDVHYQTLDGRHSSARRYPLRDITADTVLGHVEEHVQHLDLISGL